MTLSEILQKYLKEHDMSQRDFAKRCGLSNGYISMIVKGVNGHTNSPIVPTLASLKCFADAMGLSLDELLSQMDDTIVSFKKTAVNRVKLFSDMFSQLTDSEQDFVISAMRGLLDGRKPE